MNPLLDRLQAEVAEWRKQHYLCDTYPAISELLLHSKDELGGLRYLREPQFHAIESYWYLRVKLNTPRLLELYRHFFSRKSELVDALGINQTKQIRDMLTDGEDVFERIQTDVNFAKEIGADTLHESLNLSYPSYILALAMGAGKTVLIGAIIATEFAMSMEYPTGPFMRNALVFAPGTTIIESLREIVDMPFSSVLPDRFCKAFMANVKIIYARKGEKSIPVQNESSYNLIVSNTEKIMLRKVRNGNGKTALELETKQQQEELSANQRLIQIASLPHLGIFSDEAHHTYGNKLGKQLKRVRSTINYLKEETDIVCVVNTTGTPYSNRQVLRDVVFWYSLQQGIADNILKSLQNGIIAYDFHDQSPEQVIDDIIKTFFATYRDTRLKNGAAAKIAFYFATQDQLDTSRGYIENALSKNSQPTTLVLTNTQTSSTREVDDFNRLNDPQNEKRVILLVGKGTEGWNCPSLFATALVRKLSSSNTFILQAATRCLRQVPGNKQNAMVFIEQHNQLILNKELRDTFATNLSALNQQAPHIQTQELEIRKEQYPPLQITRIVKRVVADKNAPPTIRLTMPTVEHDDTVTKMVYQPNMTSTGTILTPTGGEITLLFSTAADDLHTAAHNIARNYHLPYADILNQLKILYPQGTVPRQHRNALHEQVEQQVQNYRVVEEQITEALAIIKFQDEQERAVFTKNKDGVYYHTIRYKVGTYGDNNEKLLDRGKSPHGDGQLGFHYTPYNFDSLTEKYFFEHMLARLNERLDDIEDIYFTGGLTNTQQTDIHFQYKGIDGRYHNYFPDFVIVKRDGSFLIVEIKAPKDQSDLIVQAKEKAVDRLSEIDSNRFLYQVIYSDSPIPLDKLLAVEKWVGL